MTTSRTLDDLDPELIYIILNELLAYSPDDLLKMRLTCRRYNKIATSFMQSSLYSGKIETQLAITANLRFFSATSRQFSTVQGQVNHINQWRLYSRLLSFLSLPILAATFLTSKKQSPYFCAIFLLLIISFDIINLYLDGNKKYCRKQFRETKNNLKKWLYHNKICMMKCLPSFFKKTIFIDGVDKSVQNNNDKMTVKLNK